MLPQQKDSLVVILRVAPEFLKKVQTLPTQSIMDPQDTCELCMLLERSRG